MAKFDLVDTNFEVGPDIKRIKAINPDVTILGYNNLMGRKQNSADWHEVDQHEDWFIHDINGKRVQTKVWGWYLMDVGNQEWRSYWAKRTKDKIDLYSFDGVFADDAWSSLPCGEHPDAWWNPWTVPNSWIDGAIGKRWHNDMVGMISFVKATLGGKLLIVNTVDNGDYVDACDGKMSENLVLASVPSQTLTDNIDALFQISGRGKYFLMSPHDIPSDTKENLLFSLSCFLLGVNGPNAYFSWGNLWTEPNHGYYSELAEADFLGFPLGEYYYCQSVLTRDFENGRVLVNVCTHAHNVDLGGEYKTLDGEVVTEITMEAQSGMLLVKKSC